MNDAEIEVSLFIAPDPTQVAAAAGTGAQFIELHTGAYAEAFADPKSRDAELVRLRRAADQAHDLGLQVNAGHGLNLANLTALWCVPHLVELNIGHSLVSRAMTTGLGQAVQEMLTVMAGYQG
jgi:pyridoxine 5-phosphate synthase